MKIEERDDIIDLTKKEETHDIKPDVAAFVKQEMDVKLLLQSSTHDEPDYSAFGDDESRASTRELLECLRNDELREVVKTMHVQKKGNTVFQSLKRF